MQSASNKELPLPSETTPLLTDKVHSLLTPGMFKPVSTITPPSHRPTSHYKSNKKKIEPSGSHLVRQMSKTSLDPSKSQRNADDWFYKEHSIEIMPQVEAFNATCYQLLVPSYVTRSVHPVQEKISREIKYGLMSRSVPDFAATTISQLKALKNGMRQFLNKNALTITDMNEIDDDVGKNISLDARNAEKIIPCHEDKGMTIGELQTYRWLKGLGCSMTASWLHQENDAHRNNIAIDGKRIDFDESTWKKVYYYKPMNLVNRQLRCPGNQTFCINKFNIMHFPNIGNTAGVYWPTFYNPITKLSTNLWLEEETQIFSQLETNAIFNYFKYQTSLKFLLCGADIYTAIAQLHIDPLLMDPETKCSVASEMIKAKKVRWDEAWEHFLTETGFIQFMKKHGESAKKRIIGEIELHNLRYDKKANKIKAHLDLLDKNPEAFHQQFKEKYQLPSEYKHFNSTLARDQLTQYKLIYEQLRLDTNGINLLFNKIMTHINEADQLMTSVSHIQTSILSSQPATSTSSSINLFK